MRKIICIPLALILLLAGCRGEPEPVSATIFAMDTVMTITAYGEGADEAIAAATEEVNRLERLLSVTRADSDIGRINAGTGPVEVDRETAELLARALSLWAETGGAFSPALYPVQRAWGFTSGEYRVPEAAELRALLALTDPEDLSLDGVRVTVPEGMELDLGGIAKGYAGDVLADLMADYGVESAMLDLGGDVRALGRSSEDRPWRVALQHPGGEGYLGILEVEDEAVITSGSYERYFTGEDGQVYHHILDPDTGRPADSGLVSVTVVTSDGAAGDALATALFVMGLDRGAQYLAGHPEIEAIFYTEGGELWLTPGLESRFTPDEDTAPEVNILP